MASAGMEKEARLVVVKHKEIFEITSICYVDTLKCHYLK